MGAGPIRDAAHRAGLSIVSRGIGGRVPARGRNCRDASHTCLPRDEAASLVSAGSDQVGDREQKIAVGRTSTDGALFTGDRYAHLPSLPLIRTLGEFDLGPCAAPGHPTACERWTREQVGDGLSLPWHGRVWLNPPYGRTMGEWLRALGDLGAVAEDVRCCLGICRAGDDGPRGPSEGVRCHHQVGQARVGEDLP